MRPAYYRTNWLLRMMRYLGRSREAEAPTAPLGEGELAAAEQRIAQIPPEKLHPEDAAELDRTAEALTKPGSVRSAYEAAAQVHHGDAVACRLLFRWSASLRLGQSRREALGDEFGNLIGEVICRF